MDDDEVEAVLAGIRHRDSVRILVASIVVALPLIVGAVAGADFGSTWDQVLAGLLGVCLLAALTTARYLFRERRARSRTSSSASSDR